MDNCTAGPAILSCNVLQHSLLQLHFIDAVQCSIVECRVTAASSVARKGAKGGKVSKGGKGGKGVSPGGTQCNAAYVTQ